MVNQHSSTAEKTTLFQSLFRGRSDVYPRRFQNRKTLKSGYAPACKNEWVRNICQKPRIKCMDCQHRQFIPVDDEVVYWHLQGHNQKGDDFVMGIYPMLLDETCYLLAADFDKANWEHDAVAFLKTCHQKNLPAVLERSRSGKGAHVWLFFEESISAALARKLGASILTETMESNPGVGLDSYDRFFPNQDTLPRGGFGNLIALPLQKSAPNAGNSVFINDQLQVIEDQWVERLQTFLGISAKKIGRFGGGRKKITGFIDIALIQSLTKHTDVVTMISQYGYVIVDECHHIPSVSFDNIIRQVKAKFITGLSATLVRKDGRHPIIMMRCGPILHRVNAKDQANVRPFDHYVFVRPTSFQPYKQSNENLRIQFQDLYEELIHDTYRNQMICNDVVHAVKKGRSPIILTERNEHLDLLHQQLVSQVQHLIVLKGGLSAKDMKQAMSQLTLIPLDEERVILATGRFIGEGFDDARLDTLFMTLPISWKGTIAQYVGRLHRLHDSKKEVHVYDYADFAVPMLDRMFQRRSNAYESVGYKIIQPASAYPGWPTDIVLPAEPLWKNDYGSTIRRLVADGVDNPLAQLFADVAMLENDQIDRARSIIEAFLFYRLETLPETKGRFQLNHVLTIPFDGLGGMEVDLICLDARVAVEIDGVQHLSSKEAYRTDRRKDLLLQAHGYMILRFLAEDVSKRLDVVLDTILRTLAKTKPVHG